MNTFNTLYAILLSLLVSMPLHGVAAVAEAPITLPDDAILVDRIEVILYNEDGIDLITHSDVVRPSLEGTFRTLDELIMERLMYLDAKRFKMIVSDDDMIDKQLQAVQKEHNLTPEQLKGIFKAAGYTYEEGRAQFVIMMSVNSILDFKIRSRLTVPEKDILAYYDANPILLPEEFFIERAVVPFAENTEEQHEQLMAVAAGTESAKDLEWQSPFWIARQDIASEKEFITQLKLGEISKPVEIANGFELFRLKAHKQERKQPLEERYVAISQELRRPRFETLMKEYQDSLLKNASIVYVNKN